MDGFPIDYPVPNAPVLSKFICQHINALKTSMAKRLSSRNISHDVSGAIAVEFALITPFIAAGMLLAANMGFSVYKHQKLFSGAYAGASYLQDEISSGDFYKLRTSDDGKDTDGDFIRIAKIVIKDAAGVPINVDNVAIQTYCGCPAVSSGENGEIDEKDFDGRDSFFKNKHNIYKGSRKKMCTYSCSDSYQARIIAQIDVSYTSSNLLGKKEKISERIVTRLR